MRSRCSKALVQRVELRIGRNAKGRSHSLSVNFPLFPRGQEYKAAQTSQMLALNTQAAHQCNDLAKHFRVDAIS